MQYRLGVEDIEPPNHWVAWVFELPGCFCSASTQEDTIAEAPSRIAAYSSWLSSHGRTWPQADEPIEVQVAEVFHSFVSESDYVVNAFFEDDRRPLTYEDVEHGLWLLECSRRDLLALIQRISSEKFGEPITGEAQGSIRGILNHAAWAEWWYFDRLNLAFERQEMPEDTLTKLEKVRAQTCAQLLKLIGDGRVVERIGEQWSARKALRRTLWHERDHTQHIAKLLGERI